MKVVSVPISFLLADMAEQEELKKLVEILEGCEWRLDTSREKYVELELKEVTHEAQRAFTRWVTDHVMDPTSKQLHNHFNRRQSHVRVIHDDIEYSCLPLTVGPLSICVGLVVDR